MRVLVFFDLPSTTKKDMQQYRKFRKFLIKNGFIMLQESVYTKLALNSTAVNLISHNVRKNKPENGLVQMITITEKQFARMEIIVGEYKSDVLQTDERIVIL